MLANSLGCSEEFDTTITISVITGISGIRAKSINLKISPNPFTSNLCISYTLSENQNVQLTVTDITGKQIATLVNENQNSGEHICSPDATKYNIPAGIYFLRMVAGNETLQEKIVRVK